MRGGKPANRFCPALDKELAGGVQNSHLYPTWQPPKLELQRVNDAAEITLVEEPGIQKGFNA
jgi:hypothetical protein